MKKTLISLIVASTMLFAAPAFAHDEVESFYPEAGSTVEAGAIDLNINFGEDILVTDGNAGLEVVVTNSTDVQQEVGCLEAFGTSLGARTLIAEPGEYKVAWRSVSQDGHPTEGEYSFKVENTSGYELNSDDLLACPRVLIEPMPVAIDDEVGIEAQSGVVTANENTGIEITLLVVVVAAVIVAAIWVTRSRKKAKN